jgi:anti-sigma regulatory factor (Ser/Thr protein kinase)
MLRSPGCRVSVSHLSDANEARRLVKAMAVELGFDMRQCEELAIVVSELASNLVKHATSGWLIFTPLKEDGRSGIRIESKDNGPGIDDVDRAITDGFSTTGSLGYGLGAVNRLMDEFEIQPGPDGKTGTHITCVRWRRERIQKMPACPLSFGVATRAYQNSALNGDAYVVRRSNELALVALIDGLGHGQYAKIAAQTAREYIENHYDQPLETLFRGAGRACRATRGVVMALARFTWQAETISLTFASVGNIEARVFGSPAPVNFIAQRGVIGLNAPNPVVAGYNWNPDYTLVLHTDGVRTKWSWSDFPELAGATSYHAARRLLQELAKDSDDATVIVVRKSFK